MMSPFGLVVFYLLVLTVCAIGASSDIDECFEKKDVCVPPLQCKNTPGSYKCVCKEGYQLKGKICEDIDECVENICGLGGKCTNTIGSYDCACKEGYYKDDWSTCRGKVVSFSGNSFMRFQTPSILQGNTTSIRMTIRPVTGSGIIFYAEKSLESNFIGLILKKRFIEFRYNLGSKSKILRSMSAIVMKKWYDIELYRLNNEVQMIIDIKETLQSPASQTEKQSKPFSVDNIFYVGGLDEQPPEKVKENLGTQSGFRGCLGLLRIGEVNYDLNFPGRDIQLEKKISLCTAYEDVDECAESSESVCNGGNTTCSNTVGSYMCVCNEGYRRDGKLCKDIDECLLWNIQCGENAKCVNTIGSYQCMCNYNFYYDGKSCQDGLKIRWDEYINMCKSASCNRQNGRFGIDQCKEHCAKTEMCLMVKYSVKRSKCSVCRKDKLRTSSKVCTSDNKYNFYKKVIINATFAPKLPATIPTRTTSLETNSKVEWIILRSLCAKVDFYNLQKADTSDECIDMCKTSKGCVLVKHNEKEKLCWFSNNRNMKPMAKCDQVFDFYVKHIDECSKTQSLCGEDGKCVNIPGTYTCSCRHGYKLHRKRCQDINECVESSNVCSPNAFCQNTDGGYQCNCLIGYQGDGKTCKDVDECAESKYVCKPFAKCVNTIGSYDCACKAGYHGDGYVCNDIDECTKGSHACDHRCTNTAGSYKCSCRHGYHAKGSTCKDINECTNSHNLCGLKASCVNQPGSYTCVCKRGFTLLEEKCIDVDECSEWKDICRQPFKCVNNIGSYKCLCKHGFRLEGKHCKDINECAKSDEVCGQNTECINKIGSYECLCKLGFQRNGTLCQDIDECTQPYHCEEHEKCVNTIGSFECKCDHGFYRSGKRCKAGDPSEASVTTTSIPAATDVPEISTRLSNENEATTNEKPSTVFTEQLPTLQSTEHLTMSVTEQPTMSPTKQPTTSITEESTSMQNEATTNEKPSTVFTEQLPAMQSTEHLTMSVTEQPTMSPTKQPTTSITEESTSMLKGESTTEPSTMSATEQRTSTFTDAPTKGFTGHPTTTPFTEQPTTTPFTEPTTTPFTEQPTTTPFTEQPTTTPPTDEDFIEETTMPTRNTSSANMTSTDMTTTPAVSTISPTTEEWFPTDLDIGITEEDVPSVEWIAHHSLCMSVSSYEVINEVSSAADCKRRCEEQTKCVIVQYDKEGSKCWLCHNRKMTRSRKCKNRYDYYIKGIDECNGERQCHHRHAVCKKAGGHKLCECIYGFQGDGFDCKDIDECSAYQHVCSANARCLNSIGSYSCKCNRGYVQNRRTCTRRKTSSRSQRKKHTATELKEVIRTWKEEHSGAISSYVVTIRTFCFGLLLPQVLYHFLVK